MFEQIVLEWHNEYNPLLYGVDDKEIQCFVLLADEVVKASWVCAKEVWVGGNDNMPIGEISAWAYWPYIRGVSTVFEDGRYKNRHGKTGITGRLEKLNCDGTVDVYLYGMVGPGDERLLRNVPSQYVKIETRGLDEMFEKGVLEWHTEGHPEVENDSDQTQCLVLLDDGEQRCVVEVWWLVNEECFVYDGEEVYDVLAWAYWPSVPEEVG